MLNIEIKTIPENKHRYPTCGDYFEKEGVTHVLVSELGNSDYEFLVAIHELVEWYLTKKRGIKEEDITAFDIQFEKNRLPDDDNEPGDDPLSPYRKEHRFAENIERQIAHEIGVDWDIYNNDINNL